MKLPRNISARDLVHALQKLGYSRTRQKGSHIRLTTLQKGEHHLSVPDHNPLKPGTLAKTFTLVEHHFQITRAELMEILFE